MDWFTAIVKIGSAALAAPRVLLIYREQKNSVNVLRSFELCCCVGDAPAREGCAYGDKEAADGQAGCLHGWKSG